MFIKLTNKNGRNALVTVSHLAAIEEITTGGSKVHFCGGGHISVNESTSDIEGVILAYKKTLQDKAIEAQLNYQVETVERVAKALDK